MKYGETCLALVQGGRYREPILKPWRAARHETISEEPTQKFDSEPMKPTTRRMCALILVTTTTIGPFHRALGEDQPKQEPFAEAEMPVHKPAQCHEIKDAIRDVPTPGELDRIDFAAVGALSLVRSDGVLAYMGICNEPDAKVLCVTYSTNDMKVGDVVNVAGSYRKVAPNFVILDPCLARYPDQVQD